MRTYGGNAFQQARVTGTEMKGLEANTMGNEGS